MRVPTTGRLADQVPVEPEAREEAQREVQEEAQREAREEAQREAREEAQREAREEAQREAREEAQREASVGRPLIPTRRRVSFASRRPMRFARRLALRRWFLRSQAGRLARTAKQQAMPPRGRRTGRSEAAANLRRTSAPDGLVRPTRWWSLVSR